MTQQSIPVDVNIHVEKSTFTIGEPISVTVELHNIDQQPALVNQRLALNAVFAPAEFRDIAFSITNEQHQVLDFDARIRIGAPTDSDFALLQPNQRVDHTYNLAQYFNFDRPGTYSIEALYFNESNPSNGQAFQGSLKSNELVITITP